MEFLIGFLVVGGTVVLALLALFVVSVIWKRVAGE